MTGDDEPPAVLKYYLECMHHEGLGQVPAFLSCMALQDVSEMQIQTLLNLKVKQQSLQGGVIY